MPVRFDVFGRRLRVERTSSGWRLAWEGADGKSRPADLQLPPDLEPEDLGSYLADLCHEWATPAHPRVRRLSDSGGTGARDSVER